VQIHLPSKKQKMLLKSKQQKVLLHSKNCKRNKTLIIFSKINGLSSILSIPHNIFVITNDLVASWIAITFILKLKPDIYDFAVDAL
jgi:hypothetical protein